MKPAIKKEQKYSKSSNTSQRGSSSGSNTVATNNSVSRPKSSNTSQRGSSSGSNTVATNNSVATKPKKTPVRGGPAAERRQKAEARKAERQKARDANKSQRTDHRNARKDARAAGASQSDIKQMRADQRAERKHAKAKTKNPSKMLKKYKKVK